MTHNNGICQIIFYAGGGFSLGYIFMLGNYLMSNYPTASRGAPNKYNMHTKTKPAHIDMSGFVNW